MELALYHPSYGYYERLEASIGRDGDFFTSVSTGSLFGELLAFQFARWLRLDGEARACRSPADSSGWPACQIVEAGAHNGRLALDVLTFFATHHRELQERLEYWIIEPSVRRRERQQETLQGFDFKVRWFDAWAQVPSRGVRGVIFSNELLDALPVVRVGWNRASKTWFEWGVGSEGDRFVWVRMDWQTERYSTGCVKILELPAGVQEVLPDGFTVEICPAAVEWWGQAAQALRQGRLLTMDYGYEEDQFIRPERANGTLRAYSRHRVGDDLLAHVGEQDLTAHVNFTAIQRAGHEAGLETESWVSQEWFLTRIAEKIWSGAGKFSPWEPRQTHQFRTLTHPGQMGKAFRVLVQSRIAPGST